ncbi:MAG: hypothetical protein KC656_34670, partial [Myxococcales bacterium]|nr:hypothetical protein [Myxococcales bacterium]
MWLASARIEGLRSAPLVEREELERVHAEPRGPDAAALADGIALAAAFLVPARAAATLAALDVALDTTTTLLDESVLDEVEALDPHGVRALVGDAPTRSVTVELDLTLDPPTFRTLRDRAARDPALLAALGTGAGVRLRIGWLFNRAGTHATTAALAVQVGDERFPTSAVDRPPWLLDLLDRVGRAIHRLPP